MIFYAGSLYNLYAKVFELQFTKLEQLYLLFQFSESSVTIKNAQFLKRLASLTKTSRFSDAEISTSALLYFPILDS